ncbi:MAG: pyruvate, phosphate dikinase [Pseudomonadota bacterium]
MSTAQSHTQQHLGDQITSKWVYRFGHGTSDGTADMKDLLGGKGANLAEMSNLGLPVPPGFTLTTDACHAFYQNNNQLPEAVRSQVDDAIAHVGQVVGCVFGDKNNPLLVSIRSGAPVSMPGMMDTVLNLGLNDQTVEGLAVKANDKRFAYDSYRRFIQMYSDVVLGVDHHFFEDILQTFKNMNGLANDTDITAEDWTDIIGQYKECVLQELGVPFPQDINAQLWGAINAVFKSWQNSRAITYRRLHDISERFGTAVNVQAMVFGNMGDSSATGVAFTRNPSTGEKKLYGEFLVNAQGEDVVAGTRTPQNLTEEARNAAGSNAASLEALMPETFAEFRTVCEKLEARYRDMQDIEFTIQDGKLWMLQTRSGKRTTEAALKIAIDMAEEGLIGQDEAILRVEPAALDQLLHPTLDKSVERHVIGKGLPASPGAACGEIVFDSDEAERLSELGQKVILVRTETSPEDIHGMHAAVGILTTRGGMTSHAAVVARGMGRPCVSGVSNIRIDYKNQAMTIGNDVFAKGDVITIEGGTGEVMRGEMPMRQPELSDDFTKLMAWADQARALKVRTNADTPNDAKLARDFGAEGIGLCRTEHMFFDDERIMAMREMILAEDERGRRAVLNKLLPMQRSDFISLFEIMSGLPVTIRLLDPPLHEFLPHGAAEITKVAEALNVEQHILETRIEALNEFNPMLGHRGCRLAISYPEITEMQARAILEAAIEAAQKTGESVEPEIMIPLVATKGEFDFLAERIHKVAELVQNEKGIKVSYTIGTMIELPRAALRAADIAQSADFFSFGTNDLTQTCFGISRDDAGRFLENYVRYEFLPQDPFVSIDQDGVGELVEIGLQRGRSVRADLKTGICGEHGGDPKSVAFCHNIGLDYVSCSPFRVPIARLAAAQAALSSQKQS